MLIVFTKKLSIRSVQRMTRTINITKKKRNKKLKQITCVILWWEFNIAIPLHHRTKLLMYLLSLLKVMTYWQAVQPSSNSLIKQRKSVWNLCVWLLFEYPKVKEHNKKYTISTFALAWNLWNWHILPKAETALSYAKA